jgi:DNA modification methylase
MTLETYQDFVKTKLVRKPDRGPGTNGPIHEMLFPFQADIVRWALRRGSAAIFADCGLGKTFMELEWLRHMDGTRLILAPLAVAPQIQREGLRLGMDVHHPMEQSAVAIGEVNVTNYDRLHRFDLSCVSALVLDESSILKNMDGKTRNMLVEAASGIRYKLASTATPAPNDHTELGNHAEFLGVMSAVEMLATFFVHDSGDVHKWRLRGHAREDYWRWLASWAVMLRRPSDLGYEDDGFILPPLCIDQLVVEGQHISDDELTLFPMEARTLPERRAARRMSTPQRVEAAADLVAKYPDEPWVVWCDLNAESTLLAKAIPGAEEVRGSQSIEEKESVLERFANGECRVLVTKPKIAGHGLNWQHCSKQVFVGLSDSWEAWYQAVRRCWRFGQPKDVSVWVVTASTEGAVVRNIQAKEERATELFDGIVQHARSSVMDELHGDAGNGVEYETDTATGDGWRCELGDCVELLAAEPTESVDFSVYSPPFADLYTYSDSPRDLGNSKGQDSFMEHFTFAAIELLRVLKPGRLMSVHCMNLPSSKVRDGRIGLKDFRGDLIRIFESAGFIYHAETVIWKNPVTAMQRTKALGLLYKQLRKDSAMSRMGIPDYVITLRKPGVNTDPITHTKDTFSLDQWQSWASPVWNDINQSDTLNKYIARGPNDDKHIAPLQLEVVRRLVRLWSNPGDVVLSPFAGIGTEGVVAIQEDRRFVGMELKRNYWEHAVHNLTEARAQHGLF